MRIESPRHISAGMHPYHRNKIANTHHNRATWTGEVVGNRSVLILLNKFPRKQFDFCFVFFWRRKFGQKKIHEKIQKNAMPSGPNGPNRLSGIIIIGLQAYLRSQRRGFFTVFKLTF
jgi:hypothetical protein